jgi:hypothetical protein
MDVEKGSLSFAQCGEGVTVFELRELKNRTVAYLRTVVAEFAKFIEDHGFLLPSRRPISEARQ